MWNEPYLETCCRSALHRLVLVGDAGRPPGLKDGPCLSRLQGMGLAEAGADGRWHVTFAGRDGHAALVNPRLARMAAAAAVGATATAPVR